MPRSMSVARAIVETIKSWGVTHIFGLPGTGNLDIYDAFYGDPDVQLITTRHEQGAAHLAEGYAKHSGLNTAAARAGCCFFVGPLATGIGLILCIATSAPRLRWRSGLGRIHYGRRAHRLCQGSLRIERPCA